MKMKITEEDIRYMVSEAVKKVLDESINELSPEFMGHAADVANSKGRFIQRDAFNDYSREVATSEFSGDGVIGASHNSINYVNGDHVCVICADGTYGTRGSNYFKPVTNEHGYLKGCNNLPEVLKTNNKSLARKLANWWNRFGQAETGLNLSDYHTYCIL